MRGSIKQCTDRGLFVFARSGGAPKGSIWLLDEFYVAASTAGGQSDWIRGTYLSNSKQAAGIIEWLSRWGLRTGSTKADYDANAQLIAFKERALASST